MCNFSKALGGSYVVSASEMRVASVWTVLDRRVRGRNPATPPSTVPPIFGRFPPFSTGKDGKILCTITDERRISGRLIARTKPFKKKKLPRNWLNGWTVHENFLGKVNWIPGQTHVHLRCGPQQVWEAPIYCGLILFVVFVHCGCLNSSLKFTIEMFLLHSSQRRFLCCSGRRSSGADCWEDAEDLWPHSSLRPAMVGVWFEMCRINLSTSTVAPDASSHLEIWHRKLKRWVGLSWPDVKETFCESDVAKDISAPTPRVWGWAWTIWLFTFQHVLV